MVESLRLVSNTVGKNRIQTKLVELRELRGLADHRRGVESAGHRRIVVGKGEVVVEARHLVDLGLRESQPLGERPQVARSQRMEPVVEAVQVLEQAVATQRLLGGEQGVDGVRR